MPSPRNPTDRPCLLAARTSLAFCSGVTRAKIPVVPTARTRLESSMPSMSLPASVPPEARPTSSQTFSATNALSPVTTLTVIPRSTNRFRPCSALVFGW